MIKPIRLVCGTRQTREQFHAESPLGLSVGRFLQGLRDRQATKDKTYQQVEVQLLLFERNSRGLPSIYNEAIEDAKKNPAVLAFVHDDVWLIDLFWPERFHEALERFDIVGLAGNTRRLPSQMTWCLTPAEGHPPELDIGFLSGTVGNGKGSPCQEVSIYGPTGQECKLLDGVLLIADSATLIDNDLRFDEQFTFDFYDLDFCRQAEIKGLTMGTWPISVMHAGSGRGGFGSPEWSKAGVRYLNKYGD